MILGIHCSVRRGYPAALDEAGVLGCEAMQMFAYRRHHEPADTELAAFDSARRASPVRRLLIHVRYLPFLASSDEARRRRSVELLARELRLARGLGGDGLVLHAGAYSPGEDAARGLARFADGAARAWEAAGGGPEFLVENVPGGGRRMGGPLEQLAGLGSLLSKRSVPAAYCLDTAHAWAQGDDLSTVEGMWRWLGRVHRVLGSENVRAFHLNDSRALLGSHREHHWHWGQGRLGLEGLGHLLGRAEYADAAGILETPKDDDRGNLGRVRALAAQVYTSNI